MSLSLPPVQRRPDDSPAGGPAGDGGDPRGASARVRLVATDLDGTLLDPSGAVSARTVAAVRAAREAGILVVPATGRPPQSVWELARLAGLGPLGVCCNGAALVDLTCDAVLSVDQIPLEAAREAVTALRRLAPEVRFAMDSLSCFTHEHGFLDDGEGWDEQIRAVADITAALEAGIIQLAARRPGWTAKALIAALTPLVADRLAVTTSGLDWVQLSLPAVTKASRLAALCQRLDIAAEEVVAVGDNLNDLPMLAWAGSGMAVANAVPDVLGAADGTLPSNADHGVAVLLEELAAGAR